MICGMLRYRNISVNVYLLSRFEYGKEFTARTAFSSQQQCFLVVLLFNVQTFVFDGNGIGLHLQQLIDHR